MRLHMGTMSGPSSSTEKRTRSVVEFELVEDPQQSLCVNDWVSPAGQGDKRVRLDSLCHQR